jgi:hypothetical protein
MRAITCLVVVALTAVPVSVSAASISFELETISFEQPFTIDIHQENPSSGVLTGIVGVHTFPSVFTDPWDVPVFDPVLGRVEGLEFGWTATADVSITSDPPGLSVVPLLLCNDNITFERSGCDGGGTSLFYPPGSPQVRWGLMLHPDSRVRYDIGISATFDILISGTATATYFYTPAAAIPEPATLLLLGSGLIASEWKRRRRVRPQSSSGFSDDSQR